LRSDASDEEFGRGGFEVDADPDADVDFDIGERCTELQGPPIRSPFSSSRLNPLCPSWPPTSRSCSASKTPSALTRASASLRALASASFLAFASRAFRMNHSDRGTTRFLGSVTGASFFDDIGGLEEERFWVGKETVADSLIEGDPDLEPDPEPEATGLTPKFSPFQKSMTPSLPTLPLFSSSLRTPSVSVNVSSMSLPWLSYRP
jgi:hypothetical protein